MEEDNLEDNRYLIFQPFSISFRGIYQVPGQQPAPYLAVKRYLLWSIIITFIVMIILVIWEGVTGEFKMGFEGTVKYNTADCFLADIDSDGPFNGSLINLDGDTSHYFLQCAPGFNEADDGNCPFGRGLMVTDSPTHLQFTATPECGVTRTVDCARNGSSAACTFTQPPQLPGSSGYLTNEPVTTVTSWYVGDGTSGGPTQAFHKVQVTLVPPAASGIPALPSCETSLSKPTSTKSEHLTVTNPSTTTLITEFERPTGSEVVIATKL